MTRRYWAAAVVLVGSLAFAQGEAKPEEAKTDMPAAAEAKPEGEAKAEMPKAEAKPEAKAEGKDEKKDGKKEEKKPEWWTNVRLWGWANMWAMPYADTTFADANRNVFRIRFARAVFDWSVGDFLVRLHFAGEQQNSAVFFDYYVTWKKYEMLNITLGQQKFNFGASIQQSGFELTMLDRAKFITQWTKLNFRDIGIAVHSARGPNNRVLDYMFALYNSSGRIPFSGNNTARDVGGMGRVVFNPGALIDKKVRIALGVTGALEHNPAATDATTARNTLGMAAVAWDAARNTYLAGADLNVTGIGGLWFLGEVMYLHSENEANKTYRRLLGWYAELGYTLPVLDKMLQPVGRFEWADSNTNAPNTEEWIWSLGVNVRPTPWLLFSGFFSRDQRQTSMGTPSGNRVEFRVQVKY